MVWDSFLGLKQFFSLFLSPETLPFSTSLALSLYTPCDNVLSHGVFDTERVTETERAGKNTLSTKILPKAWDNAGEFWERWVRDI